MTSANGPRLAIERERLVAIVRRDDPGIAIAEALLAGGVRVAEISLTSRHALEAIRKWSDRLGSELLLGAGTVLTRDQARAAAEAGARFLVAPNLDESVLEVAREEGILYVPGALTPSEAIRAQAAGTGLVKLFPAGVFEAQYVRDLLTPLPSLRLVATGGIGPGNAAAFLESGAVAVAVSGSLVSEKASVDEIRRCAERLVTVVAASAGAAH